MRHTMRSLKARTQAWVWQAVSGSVQGLGLGFSVQGFLAYNLGFRGLGSKN